MCGNYNNDNSDDKLKPDNTQAMEYIELGNSWRAEGDDDPGSVSDPAYNFTQQILYRLHNTLQLHALLT